MSKGKIALADSNTRQKKIPVVELFGPTAQGEGMLCGQISYFIRTGLCGYLCSWCDSLHAVLPREVKKNAMYMSQEEIAKRIVALTPGTDRGTWVTLTGGDPVIWDLTELVTRLKVAGYRVAVETQGALWQDWLEHCDLVTCSPKPPSSGMAEKFKPEMLQKYAARLRDHLVIKVVTFDGADLNWAERIHTWMPRVRFFLSSGTPMSEDKTDLRLRILDGYKDLVERVLATPSLHDVTVLPQVHSLIWQRELGR